LRSRISCDIPWETFTSTDFQFGKELQLSILFYVSDLEISRTIRNLKLETFSTQIKIVAAS